MLTFNSRHCLVKDEVLDSLLLEKLRVEFLEDLGQVGRKQVEIHSTLVEKVVGGLLRPKVAYRQSDKLVFPIEERERTDSSDDEYSFSPSLQDLLVELEKEEATEEEDVFQTFEEESKERLEEIVSTWEQKSGLFQLGKFLTREAAAYFPTLDDISFLVAKEENLKDHQRLDSWKRGGLLFFEKKIFANSLLFAILIGVFHLLYQPCVLTSWIALLLLFFVIPPYPHPPRLVWTVLNTSATLIIFIKLYLRLPLPAYFNFRESRKIFFGQENDFILERKTIATVLSQITKEQDLNTVLTFDFLLDITFFILINMYLYIKSASGSGIHPVYENTFEKQFNHLLQDERELEAVAETKSNSLCGDIKLWGRQVFAPSVSRPSMDLYLLRFASLFFIFTFVLFAWGKIFTNQIDESDTTTMIKQLLNDEKS